MEFKLNSSPHLEMSEITKKLFNRDFHSDVQFSVDGKIIYAHSLELMKRSVVFEQQLENTIGDIKLIPIDDCKYENFFEFIRFIYTDECEINEDNGIDILTLATKYKVIILENRVLRFGSSTKWLLRRFEHCIRDKYEIVHNWIHIVLALNFASCFKNDQFQSLPLDTVDELLKFQYVKNVKDVSEVEIFSALADWITTYCKTHHITLAKDRKRFDKLIRKIRFPTMSIEEIRQCAKTYPGVLNKNDRVSIAMQTVFGESDENDLWISNCREEFNDPVFKRSFSSNGNFDTILSVSKDTILQGVRIGVEYDRKPIQIEICETNDKTCACQNLIFVQNSPDHWGHLTINLADSIQLKPNFKYTISIKYSKKNGFYNIVCRKEMTDVIINDPGKTVNIIHVSDNMLEMFFKPPSD